jgi:hypothetical protein
VRTLGATHPLDRPPERGRVEGWETIEERFDLFEMLHERVPLDGTPADHLLDVGLVL